MVNCVVIISAMQLPCLTLPGCKTTCLSGNGSRLTSEAPDWLEWILKNYYGNWDVAVFMHNHHNEWHRRGLPNTNINFSKGLANTGCSNTANLNCTLSGNWESYSHEGLHYGIYERPFLIWAANLFGKSIDHLISENQLKKHLCCSEAIVHKSDLHKTPRQIFYKLHDRIKYGHGNEP